jgi:hypothetical protein
MPVFHRYIETIQKDDDDGATFIVARFYGPSGEPEPPGQMDISVSAPYNYEQGSIDNRKGYSGHQLACSALIKLLPEYQLESLVIVKEYGANYGVIMPLSLA